MALIVCFHGSKIIGAEHKFFFMKLLKINVFWLVRARIQADSLHISVTDHLFRVTIFRMLLLNSPPAILDNPLTPINFFK